MRKPGLLAILILALGSRVSVAADGDVAAPYDVLAYQLSVAVDFSNSPEPPSPWRGLYGVLNTLKGTAVISVRNVSGEPLEGVSLVLHRLMKVEGMELEGRPLPFRQTLRELEDWESFQVRQITARWPVPLPPEGEATVTLRYGGQLQGYPEVGMLYVRETLDPDFTILRSESFCYPQVVEPARRAVESAWRNDPFDQKLELTLPVGHVAVFAGEHLSARQEGDSVVHTFASRKPEAVFLVPIAPYRVLTVDKSRIHHFASSTEGARILASKMETVLTWLEDWFGPGRSDLDLQIAEIPQFFGSQARPVLIQTSGAFSDPERQGEFYHELSHLWNAPDTGPSPSRWNEGLAVFLQGLITGKLEDDDSLEELLTGRFSAMQSAFRKEPRLARVAPIDYGRENLTHLSYSVGALFFGLLCDQVGEERLLDFIGEYSREHYDAGSTDSEFAAAITAELGPEVEDIVRDWFLTAGFADRLLGASGWAELRDVYRR